MNERDEILDLAYPYALDALDPDESAELEIRLADAPADLRADFDRTVAEVRETMAAVSQSTAVEPPANLRAKILDAIDDPAPTPAPAPTLAKVIPMRQRWALIAAGVAAAIAVLAGSVVVVNQLNSPTEITLAESIQEAPDRIVKTQDLAGGILQVTFSRQLEAAVIHMESVPLAPEGKTYQLWLVEGDTPKSGGLMKDPNGDTTIGDLGGTSSLRLTIEPDGGSEQPTSAPIAVADL